MQYAVEDHHEIQRCESRREPECETSHKLPTAKMEIKLKHNKIHPIHNQPTEYYKKRQTI